MKNKIYSAILIAIVFVIPVAAHAEQSAESRLKSTRSAYMKAVTDITPRINIVYPNSAIKVDNGEEITLKWQGINLGASNIDADLLSKTGETISLMRNVSNIGQNKVTIPSVIKGNYYVVIKSSSDSSISDKSAAPMIVGKVIGSNATTTPPVVATTTSKVSITRLVGIIPGIGKNNIAQGKTLYVAWDLENIPKAKPIVMSLVKASDNSFVYGFPVGTMKSPSSARNVIIPRDTLLGDYKIAVGVNVSATSSVVGYSDIFGVIAK